MEHHNHICHDHDMSDGIIYAEILHHLPYAIISIALGLIIISLLDSSVAYTREGSFNLFHTFHFLHLIFATSGSIITFLRFSKNVTQAVIISMISSIVFCTLSDIILPYISALILGMSIHLHICLKSELHNVIPFLLIGVFNGLVLSKHSSEVMEIYSMRSHFAHILISSLASLFYLVSEGMCDWYHQMGLIFLMQIIAVLIPCTFADLIVPLFFARLRKKDEKYHTRPHQKIV